MTPDLGGADMIGVVFYIDDTEPAVTHPSRIWLEILAFPKPRAHTTDRAGIGIWARTEVFVRSADDVIENANFLDIHVDDTVQVWHGEAEYRSLPPQYDGIRVEILRGVR